MTAQIISMAKSESLLSYSQLAFRIGLVRNRTASYPLNKLDFIMMDIEWPLKSTRHAYFCTGDLTGRVLEMLCCIENLDGKKDPRLNELFERILRTHRPSGLFGRYMLKFPECELRPLEEDVGAGSHRLFNGFIKYYELTGDWRALEAAVSLGDWNIKNKDRYIKRFKDEKHVYPVSHWMIEPLAGLYKHTREKKYLDFAGNVADLIGEYKALHSHGLLTTMRGMQLMAIYTGDMSWNEKPEYYRNKIIDENWEYPDGCISEYFPRHCRNEGCSVADWLMLNLNSAFISGRNEAYGKAENILWNALFFNQFVTGGFGHRDMNQFGYKMGPMVEAWWCCTENCGLAMAEYARHAVTLRDGLVSINLLTPGRFTLSNSAGPNVEVKISTSFPAGGEANISVKNLPSDWKVNLRIPDCIKSSSLQQTQDGNEVKLRLNGKVGHYLEKYDDKAMLRYGPVILAPMVNYWNTEGEYIDAMDGYCPRFLPKGLPKLACGGGIDSDGFLNLNTDLPVWTHFGMGIGAELAVEGASANVPVTFDNGEKMDLWFSPLCHITSTMAYYETPIMFKI